MLGAATLYAKTRGPARDLSRVLKRPPGPQAVAAPYARRASRSRALKRSACLALVNVEDPVELLTRPMNIYS
jgi:hypothetical protein